MPHQSTTSDHGYCLSMVRNDAPTGHYNALLSKMKKVSKSFFNLVKYTAALCLFVCKYCTCIYTVSYAICIISL